MVRNITVTYFTVFITELLYLVVVKVPIDGEAMAPDLPLVAR